jgi:crotonobetainyl-CoA:carnitine CoA-transferase CaiB-like acyl-CoA transferase
LVEAIGAPELATDERFANGRERLKRRPEMTVELEKHLAARTASEWVDILTTAGVPAGPVLNVEECFANEQVKTLPVVATVQHHTLGEQHILGSGVNLERTPTRFCSAAPDLGQHTDEILGELGYSRDEIAQLHASEAV